jgi:hypothetical protein
VIFPINGDLKLCFFNFSHFYMTKSSVVVDVYAKYALKMRVIDLCAGNSGANEVFEMEISPIKGSPRFQCNNWRYAKPALARVWCG